jgi:hypothetical protein
MKDLIALRIEKYQSFHKEHPIRVRSGIKDVTHGSQGAAKGHDMQNHERERCIPPSGRQGGSRGGHSARFWLQMLKTVAPTCLSTSDMVCNSGRPDLEKGAANLDMDSIVVKLEPLKWLSKLDCYQIVVALRLQTSVLMLGWP